MAKIDLTPKQESFCQLYIELGNASEAYRQSYDADSMQNDTVNRRAKELLDNSKIGARLDLIRKEHAMRHNITVNSLLLELEEARKTALDGMKLEKLQVAAAVAATMGKAKLLGMDKQVIDHTSSDGTMSPKQSINVGKLTDEQLRSFDALISQAGEAGAIET